MIIDMNNI